MAEFELTSQETRVLGCLLEKEMATPEYYPLSLNGLVNACNQKSNRNPVVSYDESTVLQALDGLKDEQLVWESHASRVPKYEEHFGKRFNLVARELSLVCLLLLRGPQTVGELRGRADRMHGFTSLEEVSETLQALTEMDFVRQLPKQPGQKEARFIHLLSGEPEFEETAAESVAEADAIPHPARSERVAVLEEEMKILREELEELKQTFLDFKQQFE